MKIDNAHLPELARRVAALLAHHSGRPGKSFIDNFRIISEGEAGTYMRWENVDVDEPADSYGFANFQKTDADANTTGTFNVGARFGGAVGSENQATISFMKNQILLHIFDSGTFEYKIKVKPAIIEIRDPIWLEPQSAAPSSPADGTLVYADGSSWDPGSGAGFYGREGGAWVKL